MPPAVLDAPSAKSTQPAILDAPAWDHANVPAWFSEMQQLAWHNYTSLPLPSRRDESWRFADLTKLKFDAFIDSAAVDIATEADLISRSTGVENSAGRIIFINGRLVHLDSGLKQLGITLQTLPDALEASKHLLNAVSSRLGSQKFISLHQAHLKDLTFIEVPKNIEVSGPIEIFQWAAGANQTVFPRTIISTKENAKVSVLEHHRSAGEEAGFSCGATQLVTAHGSSIDYVLCQQWNRSTKAIHVSSTHCAKDSKANHCSVNLGASWSRTECVSHLEGPGSRSDMLSVSLTDDDQELDQRTLQLHNAPHAMSDLLYKNVLFGKSRNIFAGLIKVGEGAHFTDAYQTCRNLLLTDECEANAMPGLEINADQVKCSHGSTSGAIDPEEIFYFESRGIPEDNARALLAQGFLGQTLERVASDSVREFLLSQIADSFETATNHA